MPCDMAVAIAHVTLAPARHPALNLSCAERAQVCLIAIAWLWPLLFVNRCRFSRPWIVLANKEDAHGRLWGFGAQRDHK